MGMQWCSSIHIVSLYRSSEIEEALGFCIYIYVISMNYNTYVAFAFVAQSLSPICCLFDHFSIIFSKYFFLLNASIFFLVLLEDWFDFYEIQGQRNNSSQRY